MGNYPSQGISFEAEGLPSGEPSTMFNGVGGGTRQPLRDEGQETKHGEEITKPGMDARDSKAATAKTDSAYEANKPSPLRKAASDIIDVFIPSPNKGGNILRHIKE